MKAVLAIGAFVAIAFAFFTGLIPGYNSGSTGAKDATGKAGEAGGQALDQASGFKDWYFSHGWAYQLIGAAILGTILIMFWKRIGGFGRACILVLGAIAVTAIFVKAGH